MKVLVTGAGGFAGAAVARRLAATGHRVRASVRRPRGDRPAGVHDLVAADLERAELAPLTADMDAVVHLAYRAPAPRDPDAAFRDAHAEATRRLAESAARASVRRFVFVSSVKAQGESTGGKPLAEHGPAAPETPYGRSKLEAERVLAEAVAGSETTATVLRPPPIYGPGARGGFRALLRLCDTPLPLPLGGLVENRRGLLGLGNLCAAIERVLAVPEPVPGVYLLSDGEDLSTADLVRRLRRHLGRRAPCFPVPAAVLRALLRAAGRADVERRLLGSLEVDSGRFRRAFRWTPPFSVDEGLAETAEAWTGRRSPHVGAAPDSQVREGDVPDPSRPAHTGR